VLGDAVNLGSRLESLTRFYGVDILVSATTREQCRDVVFLPVDRIRVRGKRRPVAVFEPLCPSADADAALRRRVRQFERAQAAYRRQAFALAQTRFRRLAAVEARRPAGRDPLCQAFLPAIPPFFRQPPPPAWAPSSGLA